MTTEQMDWLDDERAGRHAPKVLRGHPTEEEIAEAKKDAPFGVIIIPDEEHTHHTREARDQCAAGDHKYAELLDDAAEREKLRELIDRPQGETMMAEEPIENRLRRAWLNGFKDGVDRASYAATESTGRWDY